MMPSANHDVASGYIVLRLEGEVDERAAEALLTVSAQLPSAARILLDVSQVRCISDALLARLAERCSALHRTAFRGLREHQALLLRYLRAPIERLQAPG